MNDPGENRSYAKLSPHQNVTRIPVGSAGPKSAGNGLVQKSSWDYEKSLLLIIEADLSSRFPYVEKVLCRDKHVLQLRNVLRRNVISTMMDRLGLRREVYLAYEELKNIISKYRFIFLSNTEGFIARNIERWIRRDFPEIILVHLQHGIIIPETRKGKKLLLSCINRLVEHAFDYSVAGEGFISNRRDYYIVCNKLNKSLLIRGGAVDNRVIVSSLFLKGEKYHSKNEDKSSGVYNRGAIFFLQCLYAVAYVDRKTEDELIHSVISWLSKEHEFVFIKQHPYCNIAISDIPSNCKFVSGEIAEIAKECGTAVSFFSEALLECEYLGLRTIAIRSKRLKLNRKHDTYDLFESVADIQEDGSFLVSSNARGFLKYYESEIVSPDELSNILVGFKNDGFVKSP